MPRLFQFAYAGVYLGGKAVVLAKDADEARATLMGHDGWRQRGWSAAQWSQAIANASVCEILIPNFTAVIFNDDGDY